jgi:predicted metal-dependent hydrolase
MGTQVQLGDLTIEVVRKDIRNIHLSVHPPHGRVTLAAPARLALDTLRIFAISKLGWIREQQRKLLDQEREAPREFLDRESHYVWGRRCLLKVIEGETPASVEHGHNRLTLRIRPGWEANRRAELLDSWSRAQIREVLPPLLEKWQRLIGVEAKRFFVQRMKTRWGSCNPKTGTIRLNTDLAKKPRECLEYIVVHELVHLLEPTHNARFVALMDQYLPKWQFHRDALNRLPVRHEDWRY